MFCLNKGQPNIWHHVWRNVWQPYVLYHWQNDDEWIQTFIIVSCQLLQWKILANIQSARPDERPYEKMYDQSTGKKSRFCQPCFIGIALSVDMYCIRKVNFLIPVKDLIWGFNLLGKFPKRLNVNIDPENAMLYLFAFRAN